MITKTDSISTIDIGPYYAILPSVSYKHSPDEYIKYHSGCTVADGFSYNSGTNSEWETVGSLREKITRFVDPEFKPL
jgi:hypothetical protein